MKTYGELLSDGGSNIVEQVKAQAARLKGRLADVDHIIAVMSGKGGVGKSALTVCIADALAMSGLRVGIVDADINGASVAKMTGLEGHRVVVRETGAQPAETELGVKVMGIDLFVEDQSAPVVWKAPTQKDGFTWRGMMEMSAVREFVSDTEWGRLDVLLVDLPPGTASLPNLVDVLPRFSGAVIVTLPTGVSKLVVKRSARMARDIIEAPVLGLVENCSYRVCPHCGKTDELYPGGDAEPLAMELDIPLLGRIPFDPAVAEALDQGQSYLKKYPERDGAKSIRQLADKIFSMLGSSAHS